MSVIFSNNAGMVPVRFPKDYPASVFDKNHPKYNDVPQNAIAVVPTVVQGTMPVTTAPVTAPESSEKVDDEASEDCVCTALAEEESDEEVVARSEPIGTRARTNAGQGTP